MYTRQTTIRNLAGIVLLFAAGWLPGKDAGAPDYGPQAESPIWVYNGHACQLFKARLTQEEAGEKCKAMGGHLAIVDTAGENTFLWRKVQGIKGVIFADICMSGNGGESAQGMMLEIDRVRVYKNEGKLADALKLYEELYGQLIKEAGDYAKSLEKSGSAEDGTVSNMPLFIQNTEEYLKSDNVACILLNNICMILAKAGNKKAAEKYFRKSLKYMPGGLDSARQDI